ncbi:hypothetical protein GRAN_0595 [Granulicella sibirica]|uniref:Uncharacterized protein n=1 Tax=Granulicella sibirica TaxID=2479048 RepID=A0A4Q0T100_9BACT|nr:hypothetical protein GRAN_0595 [Granulicella sibirica]
MDQRPHYRQPQVTLPYPIRGIAHTWALSVALFGLQLRTSQATPSPLPASKSFPCNDIRGGCPRKLD